MLTLGRGARRWLGFPFDARRDRLGRVGAVLRRLVLPRRRRQAGGSQVGRCRRRVADVIAAHAVAGRRGGAGAAASPAVAGAALALKVYAHLHLHHLGRALHEVGPRAGLQLLAGDLADGSVGGAAQLPRPAAFPLWRGERRAEERVARHVVHPLLRDVVVRADLVYSMQIRRRWRYCVLIAKQRGGNTRQVALVLVHLGQALYP